MSALSSIRGLDCRLGCQLAARLQLAVWACALARPCAAQTQVPAFELAWSAPAECPDHAALMRMLRERMPAEQTAAGFSARAQIVREAAEYRLDLQLQGPRAHAQRSLRNAHCAQLAQAAAVLISLAIDTDAWAVTEASVDEDAPDSPTREESSPNAPARGVTPASPAQRPATRSAPEPTARSKPSAPTLPVPRDNTGDVGVTEMHRVTAPSSEPQVRAGDRSFGTGGTGDVSLQLTAAARAGLGTLPRVPAWGMQAQLVLRVSGLYVAAGATYWTPQQKASNNYPGAQLRGSAVFADASVGAALATRPVELVAALSLEAGQLRAAALGIEGPDPNRVLWLATGPALLATLKPLSRWRFTVDFSGLVPIFRTRWLVRTAAGDVAAFVAAPVALRLSLRIGYAFR